MQLRPFHPRFDARPTVWLVGAVAHPEFCRAAELLRNEADVSVCNDVVQATRDLSDLRPQPELILLAQSRPSAIVPRQVAQLQLAAPLAGVVSLLGSWCEGQGRSNRPGLGNASLYWYRFAAWWRRQLALRAAGCCPDWARPDGSGANCHGVSQSAKPHGSRGLIVVAAPHWDTADALADVLHEAGHATVWQRPGRHDTSVRGSTAGIWNGGQLDAREEHELKCFVDRMALDGAPVVALLDFPRHDRVMRALEIGVTTVLGKPWRNDELIATLQAAELNGARAA